MFEVLGEASVPVEPGKGSFDDPASRENDKPFCGIRAFDDLDDPLPDFAQRLSELVASIATIGENMAQPREAFDDLGQHQRCSVTVLDVGSVDNCMDEVSVGVGQDVALAALHLLASVIALWPAAFGGFDALAVDHPGTGDASRPAVLRPISNRAWFNDSYSLLSRHR